MKKLLLIALLATALVPSTSFAARFYIATDCVTPGNGTSATCSGANAPLATMRQFTDVARVAGDVGIVKRGVATTTDPGVAMSFTTDGTLNAPITLMADYDNAFNNFATSSQTVTAKFGSVYMATSASTTDMFPHQWIYLAGDCYENPTATSPNGCEYAYEIEIASSTGIQLYLPYKGNQAGTGKVPRVMPFISNTGIVTGTTQTFTMSADDYWYIKGMDLRSTAATCAVANTNSASTFFTDFIAQGNGTTDCGYGGTSIGNLFRKTRFFGQVTGFGTAPYLYGIDILIDCNNVASSQGIGSGANPNYTFFKDFIVKRCVVSVGGNFSSGRGELGTYINGTMPKETQYSAQGYTRIGFEDLFSQVGLNSQTSNQISANTVSTTTVSTTTAYATRTNGTTLQQYFDPPSGTGNTGLSSSNFPASYIKIFEYPFYTTASTAYTVTAYFLSTSTSQWSVDPVTDSTIASTTPEMFIECEFYKDDTDADRQLKRSNVSNDVDFNGSTTWQDIAVTFTPSQTGITYCRGWYGKKKETGSAMNQFLMDTKVDITH
jgi:hypothetical protein